MHIFEFKMCSDFFYHLRSTIETAPSRIKVLKVHFIDLAFRFSSYCMKSIGTWAPSYEVKELDFKYVSPQLTFWMILIYMSASEATLWSYSTVKFFPHFSPFFESIVFDRSTIVYLQFFHYHCHGTKIVQG